MRSAPLWGRAQAQAGRLRTGSASAGSASPVGSIRKRSPDMDADGIDAVFFSWQPGLLACSERL